MRYFLIFFFLFATSCGSSSSDSTSDAVSFSGIWNLAYIVLVDECGLVAGGAKNFNDTQVVTQIDNTITLQSDSLAAYPYNGKVREGGSFLAQALMEGDLFGDGAFCQLIEDIAYNDLNENTASSLYKIRVKCDDGYVCDSAVRGEAKKVSP